MAANVGIIMIIQNNGMTTTKLLQVLVFQLHDGTPVIAKQNTKVTNQTRSHAYPTKRNSLKRTEFVIKKSINSGISQRTSHHGAKEPNLQTNIVSFFIDK